MGNSPRDCGPGGQWLGFIFSVVVVLVGELSWWGIVLGIVVLVGNGWALFLSGGELSSWGVVLEPNFYYYYARKFFESETVLLYFKLLCPI